ncbi:hypothetical protein [Streptomyces scabiei]|jgi:hypothetical protein|uniref:hypothetical protein n=1 Tax=Streptomyces scabiei TaxID=1930 RepID=UPI0029AB9D77|nr:hypothetical protein [Streptomyces scabiei]MDX3206093.1 hypothetical protein [Streptomyces scabiei]
MRDAFGREVVIRTENGHHGYGTQPFSITRQTRMKVRYVVAEWLPTSNRAWFRTKGEAVAFIKAHESAVRAAHR